MEGNHGASIGELDEKTLFYLMSRGFTKEAAQKMIARARLDAVANQIMEPSVREKTLKYLRNVHDRLQKGFSSSEGQPGGLS